MTRRVAASVAAVVLGCLCVWLGRAVLHERSGLRAADASLAAPAPLPPAGRADPVGERLLGTSGDRQARDGAAAYARALALPSPAPAARAEAELAPLAASGPAARRSWAATLVAVLEYHRAGLDRAHAREHLARSVAALQAAVGAAPGDDDAKTDLELLLSLQRSGKSRGDKAASQQQRSGSPGGSGKAKQHATGKGGATPPGSGW